MLHGAEPGNSERVHCLSIRAYRVSGGSQWREGGSAKCAEVCAFPANPSTWCLYRHRSFSGIPQKQELSLVFAAVATGVLVVCPAQHSGRAGTSSCEQMIPQLLFESCGSEAVP